MIHRAIRASFLRVGALSLALETQGMITESPRGKLGRKAVGLPHKISDGFIQRIRPIVSTHLARTPHFGLGQTSVTSKRVGHNLDRTSNLWMGACLSFRKTYHEGIYPFMGQTCCYAPDENSCLF